MKFKRPFTEEDWNGTLVSDPYGVYKKWPESHQSCLAHLIRDAKNLLQREDEYLQRFGKNILKILRRLCSFSKRPPSEKQWVDFYSQLITFIILYESEKNDAGKFTRRLNCQIENLWTFLTKEGVEPTNNRAERAIRFGVLWRKCSKGTQSDKGDRWVERILSLKQTCRIKSLSSFNILQQAIKAYFNKQEPELAWIA